MGSGVPRVGPRRTTRSEQQPRLSGAWPPPARRGVSGGMTALAREPPSRGAHTLSALAGVGRKLWSVRSCDTCYSVRPRGPVPGPGQHEGLGVGGPHTLAPRPKRAQRAGPEPRALLSSAKPCALYQPGGRGSDDASSALEGVSRQQNASTVRRWRLLLARGTEKEGGRLSG